SVILSVDRSLWACQERQAGCDASFCNRWGKTLRVCGSWRKRALAVDPKGLGGGLSKNVHHTRPKGRPPPYRRDMLEVKRAETADTWMAGLATRGVNSGVPSTAL